jgi:hypothetical protein
MGNIESGRARLRMALKRFSKQGPILPFDNIIGTHQLGIHRKVHYYPLIHSKRMSDGDLESKFREYTGLVLTDVLGDESPPVKPEVSVNFESDSRTTFDQRRTPNHLKWVQNNSESIKSLESFQKCKKSLLEYDQIQIHHTGTSTSIDSILLRFPAKLLEMSSEKKSYTDQDFDGTYTAFIDDLFSDTLPTRVYIPLQAVRYSGKEIEFNDGSKIREIEEQDIERVLNFGATPSQEISWDWRLSWFLFETWYQRPKQANDYQAGKKEAEEKIKQILTALRLSYPGNVGYGTKYEERNAAWEWNTTGYDERIIQPRLASDYLHIENDDKVKYYYHLLDNKDFEALDPPIRMSIDRFNESFLRENPKVAFADLIIVLEALFEKTDDVPKRGLAQRVATLLGDTVEDREEIFENIVDIYTERSAVWGVGHGTGRMEIDEQLLEQAKKYSRQSLKLILEIEKDYTSISELIDEIDTKMIEDSLKADFSPKQ